MKKDTWAAAPGGYARILSDASAAFSALIVVTGLLVAACSCSAAPLDAEAHSKLTDGQRATSDPDDYRWLTFEADAAQLPKSDYELGEFAFWGLNAPHYLSPGRTPLLYQYVKEANIRGVRYDILWGGVEQNGPGVMNYNWMGLEEDIDAYVADGFTVQGLIGFTPAWANGMRDRAFPPNNAVEQEVLAFVDDVATVANRYVISTEQDAMPFVVTPETPAMTRRSSEVITTNFKRGDQPRCSFSPVLVGTEQVWVNENDGRGYRLWTRAENLINSPDGAEHYQFDRSGRVKFRNDSMFWYHGRTPTEGSSVMISYDSIDQVYEMNVDYTFDPLTGLITRLPGDHSGSIPVEEFTNNWLNTKWQWMNGPVSWNSNTTKPGHLHYPIGTPTGGVGHFLNQTLQGSGNFTLSMRITTAAKTGTSQTGIMVYQNSLNWFRYAITSDGGRPYLTRCINGEVSVLGISGELGFNATAPRWITVRKVGDTYTAFTSLNDPSKPDGGYQWEWSFTQSLQWPLRVGISSTGTDTVGVDIDSFLVKAPSIPAGTKVRVWYNYLNTAPAADFARRLVTYFKDRVRYWEIGNEPDQGWTWRASQQLYAIYLRDVSQAVRQADPEAVVVSGGYANGAANNLHTIYNTISKDNFDMVAWHPYAFSNLPPDTFNWGLGNTNNVGRTAMLQYGDGDKEVFFGELATTSGTLASGGGMNDRKQAEYLMRLLLWSRRVGYCKGIQLWPGADLNLVGTMESDQNGAHDGLFYSGSGLPKPAYWITQAAATNKGVLIDLVNYDTHGNPVPAARKQSVKTITVGLQDRATLASMRVLTSLTTADPSCRPPVVAARHIGQAGAAPFTVAVTTTSSALRREAWTVTAVTSLTFAVTGSESGAQGVATVGIPFVSMNGVVRFTIGTGLNPYIIGDRFEFETFAGDGWQQSAFWQNPGLTGSGDITITLPSAVDARYISLQFLKAPSAANYKIDEIRILDTSGADVSTGQLYIVDGYAHTGGSTGGGGEEPPPNPETLLALAKQQPDGTEVTLTNLILYYKDVAFGYVEARDRAAGIRIQGTIPAAVNDVVAITGTMGTTANGERFIQIGALTTIGVGEVLPLKGNNLTLQHPMLEGSLLSAYGFVQTGSIRPDCFTINDGGTIPGIKVITKSFPQVFNGAFVTVTGAGGRAEGRRVIYQK